MGMRKKPNPRSKRSLAVPYFASTSLRLIRHCRPPRLDDKFSVSAVAMVRGLSQLTFYLSLDDPRLVHLVEIH
jgi:hypothetical protein